MDAQIESMLRDEGIIDSSASDRLEALVALTDADTDDSDEEYDQ